MRRRSDDDVWGGEGAFSDIVSILQRLPDYSVSLLLLL